MFSVAVVRMVIKMQLIPQNDRVAMKVLIPKSNSRQLAEFRDLTMFNTSLKTVMGVWYRRVRRFMLQNRYFNINIQKGFLPKISGCVEHNQTVIDLLRTKSSQVKMLLLSGWTCKMRLAA